MTINNNQERINQSLNLLAQGLYRYIEQEMKEVYPDNWLQEAKSSLKDQQAARKRNFQKIFPQDVSLQLKLIIKQWDGVFKNKLSKAQIAIVEGLIEVRNNCTHQSSFSTDDTYEALYLIAKFIKAIDAPEAEELAKEKQVVSRLLYQEQFRHEIRHNISPEKEKSIRLGDAVLGFLVGELLHRRYKEDHNLKPKKLTRLRSLLVDEKQLAKFAVQLRIGKKMRLGKGAEKDGDRQNPALLSDIFEAIIGAYFIDSNLMNLRSFVKKIFQPVADYLMSLDNDLVDTKAKFQQWALEKIEQIPKYESNKCGGSDNKPNFYLEYL